MPRPDSGLRAELAELADTLRAYAVQETMGPLRGLGRYLLFGLAGALGVSLGIVFGALAVVRVLQSETGLFNANWSFVPYLAGAALPLAAIVMAARAIGSESPRPTARRSRRAAETAAGKEDD